MTGLSSESAPDGSVYDAIYLAVAERVGAPFDEVRRELIHREVPDDSFWAAWDSAVNDATDTFYRATDTTPKED